MKDKRFFTFPVPVLVRGVCGYVIIIALLCVVHVYSGYGQELAVELANGLPYLFFFALGGFILDILDWILFGIISKLKRSNGSETDTKI